MNNEAFLFRTGFNAGIESVSKLFDDMAATEHEWARVHPELCGDPVWSDHEQKYYDYKRHAESIRTLLKLEGKE